MTINKLIFSKLKDKKFGNTKSKTNSNDIGITFKTYKEASIFLTKERFSKIGSYIFPIINLLPFEVNRNVDQSLSIDDIIKDITWKNNTYKVINIQRLKFISKITKKITKTRRFKIHKDCI